MTGNTTENVTDVLAGETTRELRAGRTTGTCATAAAMAALRCLLTGERRAAMSAPLPAGGVLTVPVARIEREGAAVRATVLKDGGDDPDATHGCEIQALVALEPGDGPLAVAVDGGRGVGRATLPGLPVPVGAAAINPDPLRQIEAGVRMAASGLGSGRVRVLVEVPEGEAIAKKTMNPRLGILGGISILGTQGIVRPYSHDAWTATIEEGMDVALALGLDHVVLTTGRRSERLFLDAHPGTPPQALVQAADFFAFSLRAAARRGFARVTWSLFFGKLAKQAQGMEYTHAKSDPVDFARLADWCAEAGCDPRRVEATRGANTARQVLDLLADDPARPALVRLLVERARESANAFGGPALAVGYAVFDFDGARLG
ncbi:cobalt-precorrin-5B (C(1))-methyltransferase CbiD [Pseudodesulfovibrio sp.]|uniref:cobalt-precorrin-5B (C(1))-methyltransferase CbiD n=1 Tax=Pseudodesulfovibrio sp. TaxID=2035812 RepID=UPI00260DE145|nr:cobalt-precorrin-5B (C(1))-methyltransferase CbiD [Pseudodesulfovibrio sp.]MDD3311950.1 cobalt-precorrin-5B (C(1))-methyltransferase CbiD [Pseudodesulfovibrio sp.]